MLPIVRLLIAIIILSTGTTALASRVEPPPVDPAATGILKQMSDYLGEHEHFSVQTQNTLEDLFGEGHRIDVEVSASVIVSRPNKIRADRKGDLVDHTFYYDGKEMTLYSRAFNVYSTLQAPDTFHDLFQFLYKKVGLGLPISDLVYEDCYSLLMQDVTFAQIVGKTYIDGVKTTHLLFSRPGVDFQIWIAQEGAPFPLKYVVTDTEGANRLSISSRMMNWNVQPGIEESQFTFVKPENAQPIDFIPQ